MAQAIFWLAELVPSAAPAPAPEPESDDDDDGEGEDGDNKKAKKPKVKKPKLPPLPPPEYRYSAPTDLTVVAAPELALSGSDQKALGAKGITRKHIGWAHHPVAASDDKKEKEWVAFVKRADGRFEELLPSVAAKMYGKTSIETAMSHRNLQPLPAPAKPKAVKKGKGKDGKAKDGKEKKADAKPAAAAAAAVTAEGVRLPYMPSSVYAERKQAFELHKLLKRKAQGWWKANRHFYARKKNRMRPRNLFVMFMRLHALDMPSTGAGTASLAAHPMAFQWFSQIIARAEQELTANPHLNGAKTKGGKAAPAPAAAAAAAAAADDSNDSAPAAAAPAANDSDGDAADADAPQPKPSGGGPAAAPGTIRVLAAEQTKAAAAAAAADPYDFGDAESMLAAAPPPKPAASAAAAAPAESVGAKRAKASDSSADSAPAAKRSKRK